MSTPRDIHAATYSNGGEELPLLGATNTRRSRPFTSMSTEQKQPNKGAPSNSNKLPSPKQAKKTSVSNIPTVSRPLALDANRNTFQKLSRPRKTVAEFRKKTRSVPAEWSGRVGIHLHVDEIDIEKVSEMVKSQKWKEERWQAVDHFEVVRLWQSEPPYIGQEKWTESDWPLSEDEEATATSNLHQQISQASSAQRAASAPIDLTAPEIYLFSFGACVFWNFPDEKYEKDWISKFLLEGDLRKCCGDLYQQDEIDSAMDDMSFQYQHPQLHQDSEDGKAIANTFTIKQDVCMLSTRDSGEKLAVSFALAKSSLLSIYELRVQQVIERNSHLPEEMAKDGKVHMTTHELSQEVGRLFLVKHGINLDQSLIDTPEEFWEDDRFESTYDITLKYLKIMKRLDLVNNRLDMIGKLQTATCTTLWWKQVLLQSNRINTINAVPSWAGRDIRM